MGALMSRHLHGRRTHNPMETLNNGPLSYGARAIGGGQLLLLRPSAGASGAREYVGDAPRVAAKGTASTAPCASCHGARGEGLDAIGRAATGRRQ
jgi:cytochrome c553